MDPVTLSLIIGISTLLIERFFRLMYKIHKSKCCGMELDMEDDCDKKLLNKNIIK